MNDKKAAKKLLKRAKEHPNWYTKDDIRYAKMVRKKIRNAERKLKHKKKC